MPQQILSSEMQKCIDDCMQCFSKCTETIQHCLTMGGEHSEKDHIALMQSCADLCQVAASSMLLGSPVHVQICESCADVCESCADDCEDMDGDFMKACAEVCRTCAESCRSMSSGADKERPSIAV